MQNALTINELKNKLEHFCAYQERCHDEVITKLRSFRIDQSEIDEVVVHLISENYLNEERFAQSFARGKHRIKNWGKVRIVSELKARNISQTNINTALKEITEDDYIAAFDNLAERHWQTLSGPNDLKKRKKFCDYLIRKGYENDLIYQKARSLEK
ncbi:MAG: RecX family transcriptional regulator [Flavobacterium sp.]|nr:MAG: RecX family transcriptional regulator [Flavobacterium sp.]